ncbi:hypothetical protein EIKCOROL_00111 [Eikenella corrodens ATCC 23834]|uniref:Uncharacterized protein n=1 Tax=Eikenella corrodens ATCC 23834 TaxID=546274 RepID=C0DRZ5_EIKCO|nr:hypothetical protein EIKCOROL_00111 [Eikenella corrodens ATCC 23834]
MILLNGLPPAGLGLRLPESGTVTKLKRSRGAARQKFFQVACRQKPIMRQNCADYSRSSLYC